MTTSDWIAIGGIAVTILGGGVAWLLKLQGQLSGKLSRDEHEKICKERNKRVEKSIDDLREDFDRRHEENRETLTEIRNSITGTHRRLDSFLLSRESRNG